MGCGKWGNGQGLGVQHGGGVNLSLLVTLHNQLLFFVFGSARARVLYNHFCNWMQLFAIFLGPHLLQRF